MPTMHTLGEAMAATHTRSHTHIHTRIHTHRHTQTYTVSCQYPQSFLGGGVVLEASAGVRGGRGWAPFVGGLLIPRVRRQRGGDSSVESFRKHHSLLHQTFPLHKHLRRTVTSYKREFYHIKKLSPRINVRSYHCFGIDERCVG